MRSGSLRCRYRALLSASMSSIPQRSRGMVISKMLRQRRRIHYWNESTHIHILFPYRRQIRVSIVWTHTQSERPEWASGEREMKNPPEQCVFLRAIFTCQGGYIILVWKAGTPFSAQQWPGCRLRCRQRVYCWNLEPGAFALASTRARALLYQYSVVGDWLTFTFSQACCTRATQLGMHNK